MAETHTISGTFTTTSGGQGIAHQWSPPAGEIWLVDTLEFQADGTGGLYSCFVEVTAVPSSLTVNGRGNLYGGSPPRQAQVDGDTDDTNVKGAVAGFYGHETDTVYVSWDNSGDNPGGADVDYSVTLRRVA